MQIKVKKSAVQRVRCRYYRVVNGVPALKGECVETHMTYTDWAERTPAAQVTICTNIARNRLRCSLVVEQVTFDIKTSAGPILSVYAAQVTLED